MIFFKALLPYISYEPLMLFYTKLTCRALVGIARTGAEIASRNQHSESNYTNYLIVAKGTDAKVDVSASFWIDAI